MKAWRFPVRPPSPFVFSLLGSAALYIVMTETWSPILTAETAPDRVLVTLAVPVELAFALRGPGGGALARLLGAESRSAAVAAAVARGLCIDEPEVSL